MGAVLALGLPPSIQTFATGSGSRVIAQSAISATLTGTVNETTLATIPIPAGMIGLNGHCRVTTLWSFTKSTTVKEQFIRLGGLSGSMLAHRFINGSDGNVNSKLKMISDFYNVNSLSVQKGDLEYSNIGYSDANILSGNVDTSVNQDLVLSGKLELGTDTMILQSYCVEILTST
jgi:hypothetical protein